VTVFNKDGSAYKPNGSLVQFDPTNPNHDLFNKVDQENILLGGSSLLYRKILIQFETMDRLYLEDRSKLWNPSPVEIFGVYEPVEPQNPSIVHGIDSGESSVMFTCNYRAVLQALGEQPTRGSIIFTPHLKENWVIVDVRLSEFQYWGALHVNLISEKFTKSLTDSSTIIPEIKTNYTVY